MLADDTHGVEVEEEECALGLAPAVPFSSRALGAHRLDKQKKQKKKKKRWKGGEKWRNRRTIP